VGLEVLGNENSGFSWLRVVRVGRVELKTVAVWVQG